MSGMKIYVANLAKYNEGELVGEWFDLPVDKNEVFETIFEPHELDENGQPLGDYAIHDYELPFEISEHENLDNLNEFIEYLQGIDSFEPILEGNYDIGDAINFANDVEMYELVENIITDVQLDEHVAYQAQEYGWQRVKYLLGQVEYIDDDYYEFDGYGNVTNISYDRHKEIVDEALGYLKEIFLEKKVSKKIEKGSTTELEP